MTNKDNASSELSAGAALDEIEKAFWRVDEYFPEAAVPVLSDLFSTVRWALVEQREQQNAKRSLLDLANEMRKELLK